MLKTIADRCRDLWRVLSISHHRRWELAITWSIMGLIALSFAVGNTWMFWPLLFMAAATELSNALHRDRVHQGIAILTELMAGWSESTDQVNRLTLENEKLRERLDALSPSAPNNMVITDRYMHDA